MKKQDIQAKSVDELADKLLELKKEALNFRFQKTTGGLEKTHRIRQVRRSIALILTVLNERKRLAAGEK